MNTITEHLSLREIGRRLNIPPSSVAYYKDRFAPYIPKTTTGGRRAKYPAEALAVFRDIRQMFNNNCSAEEVEAMLQNTYTTVSKDNDGGSMEHQLFNNRSTNFDPSKHFVDELSGVLSKMSGVLENQALFRTEIDNLRQEVSTLHKQREKLEERYKQKISSLEGEIENLRSERAEMIRFFMERMGETQDPTGQRRGRSAKDGPDQEFLTRPLVIRNEKNEFLGVASKARAFTMEEFIRISMRNNSDGRTVAMRWKRDDGRWVLHMQTAAPDQDPHEHILHLAPRVTPNGNNVVELTTLQIDGNTVPQPFLLVLFRKIKEEFEA